jgi:hypothetical protein
MGRIASQNRSMRRHSLSIRKIIEDNDISSILFTKKNGRRRRMICTLNMGRIPEEAHPSTDMTYITSQIRVWDLKKSAWRSFRPSSLIDIEEVI